MEGELRTRLPLHHPDRIKARDLKLQLRDEERANRNELSRYRCPCNLCGGRRRPYKRSTVARHLRHRGRHGALRGWTQVIFFTAHAMRNWFCEFPFYFGCVIRINADVMNLNLYFGCAQSINVGVMRSWLCESASILWLCSKSECRCHEKLGF